MAGPLTGLGSGQQLPIANTFQPGQGVDQKQIDDTRNQRKNITLPANTKTAQAEPTQARNVNATRAPQRNTSIRQVNDNQDQSAGSNKRGSTIDITV